MPHFLSRKSRNRESFCYRVEMRYTKTLIFQSCPQESYYHNRHIAELGLSRQNAKVFRTSSISYILVNYETLQILSVDSMHPPYNLRKLRSKFWWIQYLYRVAETQYPKRKLLFWYFITDNHGTVWTLFYNLL